MNLHPHVHCLVTGGGLDAQQQWRALRYDYLLPVAVVKALYKGKLLAHLWAALSSGELRLPAGQDRGIVQRLLRRLNEKTWNVHIQERYPQGHGVMLYLSRYVKGGALSERRLYYMDNAHVTFGYTDHHDQKPKQMTLNAGHFLQRILWHVPEPGQHTVRQYGLYAHNGRDKRALCREQLGQSAEQCEIDTLDWQRFMVQAGRPKAGKCSTCGKVLLRCGEVARRKGIKNSLYKRVGPVHVQQDARPDAAQYCHYTTGPPGSYG